MRRVLTTAVALALLAGCSATPPPPDVTFYADGNAVRATPQILCDIAERKCDENPDALVGLKIRPGKVVQVSVSSEIAEEPWGVLFSYLDREGKRVDASSRIFLPANKQHAYTLELPNSADQLLFAAVQKLAVVNGDQLLRVGQWVMQAN
ncbi:Protein of unknown function [Actinokineospora alba]|uniref:DUF2771 family protein n=1 Tax=Actinokineospora alba TaxID=504798 RepID=A0A1H0SB38_9PSEU|nr:DUF2771 family protein [Actinokineospora alba]TDP66672.1 uncharacterized protein DUF2771 [Actinokineospora alba]SDI52434.1 Protein of unknown function [Actinokineospora alba]SDP38950.1 Protein of unknown function [Actinokineospora alba]